MIVPSKGPAAADAAVAFWVGRGEAVAGVGVGRITKLEVVTVVAVSEAVGVAVAAAPVGWLVGSDVALSPTGVAVGVEAVVPGVAVCAYAGSRENTTWKTAARPSATEQQSTLNHSVYRRPMN
jgi:hypothetical protein